MLLSNVERPEDVLAIANRLKRTLSDPFVIGGKEIHVTVSVGAAISPDDGEDAETLLHNAETAMKDAKARGGGLARLRRDSREDGGERELQIARLLRGAIEREEFEVHYQPLVNLETHQVVGAEALLRWEHPELGKVSPAEFVPLAEDAGLINEIGAWVLRTACRQLRSWLDEGLPPIRIAVNVSAQQLLRGGLAELVRRTLEEFDIDGGLLELELSERGALRSDPSVLQQLVALKEMGIRLSVDDFGTGNSAIAYLRRFPLDALKIGPLLRQGGGAVRKRRGDYLRDDRDGAQVAFGRGGRGCRGDRAAGIPARLPVRPVPGISVFGRATAREIP